MPRPRADICAARAAGQRVGCGSQRASVQGLAWNNFSNPTCRPTNLIEAPSARRALWLKRARARAQERLRDVDSGQPATLLTYIPERALANSSAAYGLQFRQLPVRGPAPAP